MDGVEEKEADDAVFAVKEFPLCGIEMGAVGVFMLSEESEGFVEIVVVVDVVEIMLFPAKSGALGSIEFD